MDLFGVDKVYFHGKIKEVFIPGWRDENGKIHERMDAEIIGFRIEILRKIGGGSYYTDYPTEIIVLEQGTWAVANFLREDMVDVPFEVLRGSDPWDDYNRVFLNLSQTPCIRRSSQK